jgi:biotin transporter BioY
VILGLGALWLGFELHLHGNTAWTMGVAPFLPGEAIKIVTAAGIFTTLERWKRA